MLNPKHPEEAKRRKYLQNRAAQLYTTLPDTERVKFYNLACTHCLYGDYEVNFFLFNFT